MATDLPPRWRLPHWTSALAFSAFLMLFVLACSGSGFSPMDIIRGIPNMGVLLADMVPPDIGRLDSMLAQAWVTIQMALVGTVGGVLLSVPLAFCASRRHSPHYLFYALARGLISLARTVPDLIWALFFIASVGLGPAAGTLAIIIDTIGFCARFFAEHLEEADGGPAEALRVIGGGRLDVMAAATLPAALPAFVGTSCFAFEKAVRSSVILGLVGAGGIGIELTVAMEMFRYPEAATVIIIIFVIVLLVEQISTRIRNQLLPEPAR